MGLKEAFQELHRQEQQKISVKREVKKELTKLKKEIQKTASYKCIVCGESASYFIKGTSDAYCKDCAIDCFGDLKHLKRI